MTAHFFRLLETAIEYDKESRIKCLVSQVAVGHMFIVKNPRRFYIINYNIYSTIRYNDDGYLWHYTAIVKQPRQYLSVLSLCQYSNVN